MGGGWQGYVNHPFPDGRIILSLIDLDARVILSLISLDARLILSPTQKIRNSPIDKVSRSMI